MGGSQVFIRHEERHMENWHQKEDRWGHDEDEECCGDGMNFARGLSYDSVKQMHEEAKRTQMEREAASLDDDQRRARLRDMPTEDDDGSELSEVEEPGQKDSETQAAPRMIH